MNEKLRIPTNTVQIIFDSMNGKAILSSAVVLLFVVSSLTAMVPLASADGTSDNKELPTSFDQRDLGIVTPPKYQ